MKKTNGKYHQLKDYLLIGLSVALSVSAELNAQELPTAATSSLSKLQSDTESGVTETCVGFVNDGLTTDDRNASQNDLFDLCTSMVETRNDIDQNSESTTNSRGLDEEKFGSWLQDMASEETFAPMRIATNAASGQISTIAARLTKLRAGNLGIAAQLDGYGYKYALFGQKPVKGGSAGDADSSLSNRLSGFINGTGGFGEIDPTAREDAADFNHKGVNAGLDARIMDNLIIGLAGNYSTMDLDFDRTSDVTGGNVESDTYGVIVYGTYYLEGFYVDGMFGYSWSDFDTERSIFVGSNTDVEVLDRTATARPDGNQRTLSLQTGYGFNAGALSFGPYAKVTHLRAEVEQYREEGAEGLNLLVHEQNVESLQSVLGGQVSYAISRSFGVVLPYLRFEWNHEFKDNSRILKTQFTNDPRDNVLAVKSNRPDRDYFGLNVGLSTVLSQGLQAFFNYKTVLDHDFVESHVFTLGMKMEF